jgi:hypothetical protein
MSTISSCTLMLGMATMPLSSASGWPGIINHDGRAFVGRDIRDLDALRAAQRIIAALLLREDGLEGNLMTLVRLAIQALGGVDVGDIFGNDIHADAFGVERGRSAVDAGEQVNHRSISFCR